MTTLTPPAPSPVLPHPSPLAPAPVGAAGAPGPTEPRDPRVDRAVAWGLPFLATVAMAAAAWQFQAMTSEIRGMRSDLGAISTRVAIVEAAGYGASLKDLELRVRVLERDNRREASPR